MSFLFVRGIFVPMEARLAELYLEIQGSVAVEMFGAVAFFHRFFACLDSLWLAVRTVANGRLSEKVKIGVGFTETGQRQITFPHRLFTADALLFHT
jgi:hypothetical protein